MENHEWKLLCIPSEHNESISKEIAKIFDVLDNCTLSYQITPMGTIVEGAADELFSLARELYQVVFSDAVRRVITIIKIDERRY